MAGKSPPADKQKRRGEILRCAQDDKIEATAEAGPSPPSHKDSALGSG